MSKVIMTYGTFDMFHVGHLNLLHRLMKLGDKLIVGVSTDEFNLQKNKRSFIPYIHRKAIVGAIEGVDLVIPEEDWDQKISDIQRYGITTFAIGSDWTGKFDFLKEYCEVLYLERTSGISTTEIKNALKTFTSVSREDVLQAIDILQKLKNDFE